MDFDVQELVTAAKRIQEYCYTQDECENCVFFTNKCTLDTETMEWTDYFIDWETRLNQIQNQIDNT